MRKRMIAAILATSLLATPAMAAGFSDGSFEEQGARALGGTGASYCYFNAAANAPTTCTPTSQDAFSGNAGLIESGSGPWGGTPALDGNYYSFVQGTGSLTQTFTATASGVFRLFFSDQGRTGNPGGGAQEYTVSLSPFGDDVQTLARAITSGTIGQFTATAGNWTARQTASFLLTAGQQYTLTFQGLSTADNTAFVDGLAISAVPEASTWAMMIMGFGMIGGALRSRRRRSAVSQFA